MNNSCITEKKVCKMLYNKDKISENKSVKEAISTELLLLSMEGFKNYKKTIFLSSSIYARFLKEFKFEIPKNPKMMFKDYMVKEDKKLKKPYFIKMEDKQ